MREPVSEMESKRWAMPDGLTWNFGRVDGELTDGRHGFPEGSYCGEGVFKVLGRCMILPVSPGGK